VWPAALEQVKAIEGGAMLAALLSGARPVTIDDSRLVISYPPSAAFSKRKVESQANRDRIADALRQVSGHTLGVRFQLSEQEAAAETEVGAEPTLSEDEVIERIKEMFDAEDVLEEQRDDPPEPEPDER
jgi:hypothetical protein